MASAEVGMLQAAAKQHDPVHFDGFFSNPEAKCNLLVELPLCDEFKDLPLSSGKAFNQGRGLRPAVSKK